MGAGKSCIGRLLAGALGLPFVDADKEIEAAAGCSIEDIFVAHGEAAFREGERRVIARLLTQPRMVLATGGGAFMDPETRTLIRERATSARSEEHTSALQSLMRSSYAVFCLQKKHNTEIQLTTKTQDRTYTVVH